MRTINVTKVKRSWPASTYDIELHILHSPTALGLRSEHVGEVAKAGSTWQATVRLTFVSGRQVLRFLIGFRTMREAIDALRTQVSLLVAEHFAHQVNKAYDLAYDEIEAHQVAEAIAQSQAKADLEAEHLLIGAGTAHGLVVSLPTLRALLGSNEELAQELKVLRDYLRNSCLLRLSDIREFAYRSRMVEHELIRRAEADSVTDECEEFAQRGTGYGSCETPLDEHGNCPNAGNHRDSHTLRAL
jgi:hypothetical protein